MVKFAVDKQLDIEMAREFLGYSHAGVNFGQNVWGNHPALKGFDGSEAAEITAYFDNYYADNEDKLQKVAGNYQRKWNAVEAKFIEASEALFNGFKFPKGKYIGYISSIGCNPRFLDDKTFQIWYGYDSPIDTTAHELMHFIFYAYSAENLPDLVKDLNPNSGLWWDVAEVFNNIVLSSEKFKAILSSNGDHPYPDHEEYLEKAVELFEHNTNINSFITQLFNTISA